jgi:hypothetical protein
MHPLGHTTQRGNPGMIQSEEESEKKANQVLYPTSLIFIQFFCVPLGVLILVGYLLSLSAAYNYLRGSPSSIDQSVLSLLGSDITRMIVWDLCVAGALIGLVVAREFISILNVVKKEESALLTYEKRLVLLGWPIFILLPGSALVVVATTSYGITSRFVSDLALSLMAGYFVAFGIPAFITFSLLIWHVKRTESRLCLLSFRKADSKWRTGEALLRIQHGPPNL